MITSITVPGLTPAENDVLNELLSTLAEKTLINLRRSRYVDSKQVTRHLGIAIPPQLESVETVIGWPEKSVAGLESRIDLDGFVVPGGTADNFGVNAIWAANRLSVEATEAHTSALKYGVSFLAVMMDDASPQPVIRNLSPTNSTVLWDRNKRRAAAGVTVTRGTTSSVEQFILYLPDQIVTGSYGRGKWFLERSPHSLGRCPIAVLPYRPSSEAPLGRSRVTQAVMSITDRAIRSLLRMEISAEFYSSPQRAILGADESMFKDADGNPVPKWTATISRYLAAPMIEDDAGNSHMPSVQQFPQMTMQPHMDMVRSDAAMFAGETSIPVNALGVIHDQPASDAAMLTAYMDLNKLAERAHDSFGYGWSDAMQMAIEMRDGGRPDGVEELTPRFRDPSTPTRASVADAVTKEISVGILDPSNPVDLEIAMERLGYDRVTINRILEGRRKSESANLLKQIAGGLRGGNANSGTDSTAQDESGGDSETGEE